jgi:hypothetical protein
MTSFPKSALCLGRVDWPEFRPLWQEIQVATPQTHWEMAASTQEFLNRPSSSDPIELTVIWQTWSDEYPPEEILSLLAALPLCRVLAITGPWCESDQRTRRSWPVAMAVPWWRASRRLKAELANFNEGNAPPWTASREEVWLWESAQTANGRGSGAANPSSISDAALATMLAAERLPYDAVVFDAEPWDAERAAALVDTTEANRSQPVWAFSSWPISSDVAAIEQSERVKVLAKGA